MKSFIKFINEANAVGAEFEKTTARMVQEWLDCHGLGKKFKARRFQTVDESAGRRDEDFSDVVVEEARTGNRFFIECKELNRSNVVNLQYDITETGELTPVKGQARARLDEDEFEQVSPLTDALRGSSSFAEFVSFLNERNDWISGRRPAEYYFDRATDADRQLKGLITAYNKAVRRGETESDCKPFDVENLRDSTKNMLVAALAWRLCDPSHTWDMFKAKGLDCLGRIFKRRYAKGKACPVKYLQFGDKLFKFDAKDDPLGLKDVPEFPDDITGDYALKFTPRFGTGSIYVTPRSEITSEFDSDYSFLDRDRWPTLCGK